MPRRRNEKPIKRVNPSGKVRWVARWTDENDVRHSAGTFDLKGPCRNESPDGDCCAQHAIWHAYEQYAGGSATAPTSIKVGDYSETWLDHHPRSERTDSTYEHRVSRVLDVELGGRPFRDWPMVEVKRRQALDLLDVLLRAQGRAASGASGILGTLSVMWGDAKDDGVLEVDGMTDVNPFLGLTVRASDPRVKKAPRRIRIWTWGQMHALCAAAAVPDERDAGKTPPELVSWLEGMWDAADAWRRVYAEPMLRTLSDCGLRLGEMLPLHQRKDVKLGDGLCGERECEMVGPHLHVRRTAWKGAIQSGTKTDHGTADPGRVTPLPPVLAGMLGGLPRRIDTPLLFPTPTGRLWLADNFYRDVWQPARERSGVDATPQEFRHTWVSRMRAAGVDRADLAAWAGHTVETATGTYTHSTGVSADAMRAAVG